MPRLILIDSDDASRASLASRLTGLGYEVEVAADGIVGASMALGSPPDAVIADLWTPGASGIQVCRFLRSEPATAEVPVLLRGDPSHRRNRYWAERAGAVTLLEKGRVGELIRILERALARPSAGDFFMLAGDVDIRERIA